MENKNTNSPRTGNDAHTPTPWYVMPAALTGSDTAVVSDDGTLVAFCRPADARLIVAAVSAVNSPKWDTVPALMSALEESADLLRAARLRLSMGDAGNTLAAWQADAARVESQARAALAAARNP